MYQPFELNNYLGQLTVLGIFGAVAFLAILVPIYRRFLEQQEASWRRQEIPVKDDEASAERENHR